MAVRFTRAEDVEAGYEYLRSTLPFRRWKLPDPDTLRFAVTAQVDRHGHFDDHDGKRPYQTIAISNVHTKTYRDLLEVLGHELVHLKLYRDRYRGWEHHGYRFAELAKQACRWHDWNLKHFIG